MLQISQTLLFALTIFSLDVFPSQATVTNSCAYETMALRGNATLIDLRKKIYESVYVDFYADTKRFVNVLESKYNLNFTEACKETGGRILLNDLTFNCSHGSKNYTIYDLRYIRDDAICVDKNCTEIEEEEIRNNFSQYRYPFNVTTTDANTAVVYNCTLTPSGSSHYDASFGLIMLFFSSLLGFLFYWIVMLLISAQILFIPISVRHIHVRVITAH